MALTTSLFTGLSGLSTNSQMLSVAGNNIANVNTHGYKRSRISFESAIVQNLRSASAPTDAFGGTNPAQVGYGARTAGITRDFSTGSLQPTGVNSDLAIEGNGFFVVEQGNRQYFTRSGQFNLDSNYNLVTGSGARVQGYGVDENYNVIQGQMEPINIPLGVMTVAEPTKNVWLSGNLNAAGQIGTQGSINTSAPLYSDAGAATPAAAGTALTSLYDAAGNALFAAGDVITFKAPLKGGAELPDKTFQVGAANTTDSDAFGATMQDVMDFMQQTLGIDTTMGGGVSMDAAGQINVESNVGTVNGIELSAGNFVVNDSAAPLDFTTTQAADGESVRTSFVAYDSLGNEMTVDLSMVLESRDNTGTQWRFFVQSEDDSDLARSISNGTLSFDTNGRLIAEEGSSFVVDRAGTGAENPQQIQLSFSNQNGSISALSDAGSQMATLNQDGSPMGTLQDFSVSEDGTIVGVFSNSLLRNLGRVAIANFSNPQGLAEVGGNLFGVTTNSGTPQIGQPGTGGLGRVVGGALEQSNVELSEEFIHLISASTGFSANSRVITTSDELIQELMNSVR